MAASGSAALRCVRTPLLVAVALVALAACGGSTAKDTGALAATKVPVTITVTSPAFENNGAIPRANSCDGPGTVPTIRWGAIPATAKTVAVVVDDPDANHFLHWLVVGLAAAPGSVPSHAPGVSELDNTGGTRGWTPPCPPPGSTHHYQFTVYALNDYVCADNGDASNGPDCSPPSSIQALPQIQGAAIAKGVLVGTYQR
jgi:Raf kinase inhibitor-like YbhB/YbcL family protein